MKKFFGLSVLVLVLMLVGCNSTAAVQSVVPGSPSAPVPAANNVTEAPLQTVTINWLDRTLGLPNNPQWLIDYRQGKINSVVDMFGLPSGTVLRMGHVGNMPNEVQAGLNAYMEFATKIGYELKSFITANRDSTIDEETRTAWESAAADIPMVELSAAQELTSFWQHNETTDTDGRKTRAFEQWTLYAFPRADWNAIQRKYLNDVAEKLPPNSPARNRLNEVYDEMDRVTRLKEELSAAEIQRNHDILIREMENRHDESVEIIHANASVEVAKAADSLNIYTWPEFQSFAAQVAQGLFR